MTYIGYSGTILFPSLHTGNHIYYCATNIFGLGSDRVNMDFLKYIFRS
jgi:hypothetical protein